MGASERDALEQALCVELLDAGAVGVERIELGPTPPDARGIVSDLSEVLDLVVTASQAAEVLAKLVRLVQRWRATRAAGEQVLELEVGGERVEGGEQAVERVVERLVALATGAPMPAGARRALVIANLEYQDVALHALRAPADDARGLERVLGDPLIGGFEVEVCLDHDEPAIRRKIADFFADRAREDLLVLHYSGHGIKDMRGRLHLAARDTDLTRLASTAVPAAFLDDRMAECASQRIVLILDCCYSGAFTRGTLSRADRSVHVAEEFGGLGRVVLTASNATEYSFEGTLLAESDGQPSVFTSALVRGLETGAADLDGNGEITVDELYDYTYQQVRREQPNQTPMKESRVEGALVLARSVRGAILPGPIREDLESDRIVLRLEAVENLARLLSTGTPALRHTALLALRDLTEHDDSARVRTAAARSLAEVAPARPLQTSTPAVSPAPVPTLAAPGPSPLPSSRALLVEPGSASSAAAGPALQPVETTTAAPETDKKTAPGPGKAPTRTRSRLPPLLRTRRSQLVVGVIALTILASGTAAVLVPHHEDSTNTQIVAASITNVAFSPDGKTLAAGTYGGEILRWNPVTGASVGEPIFETAESALAFSPDGTTLAVGGAGLELRNPATGILLSPLIYSSSAPEENGVNSVAFSPDGKALAVGNGDGTVRIWSVATHTPVGQPLTDPDNAVSTMAFSPDSSTLAVGYDFGDHSSVLLWSVTTGKTVGSLLAAGDSQSVAFSPDGKTLADGRDTGVVLLWDVATDATIGQPLTGTPSSYADTNHAVNSVAFTPDGKTLAVGNQDGTVRLWNPATGQPMDQTLAAAASAAGGPVYSLAFSPDGNTLAVGYNDGAVRLWDVNATLLHTLKVALPAEK